MVRNPEHPRHISEAEIIRSNIVLALQKNEPFSGTFQTNLAAMVLRIPENTLSSHLAIFGITLLGNRVRFEIQPTGTETADIFALAVSSSERSKHLKKWYRTLATAYQTIDEELSAERALNVMLEMNKPFGLTNPINAANPTSHFSMFSIAYPDFETVHAEEFLQMRNISQNVTVHGYSLTRDDIYDYLSGMYSIIEATDERHIFKQLPNPQQLAEVLTDGKIHQT